MAASKFNRLCERTPTQLYGEIEISENVSINVPIHEISRTGFGCHIYCNLPQGCFVMKVRLHKNQKIEVYCERVWQKGDESGFRLLKPSEEWNKLVEEVSFKKAAS